MTVAPWMRDRRKMEFTYHTTVRMNKKTKAMLYEMAKAHHRGINSEMLYCIKYCYEQHRTLRRKG